MRVRPARGSDAAAIAALSGELGYASTVEQIARRIDDIAAVEDAAIFVAEGDDGTVAGWLHVFGKHLIESDPYAEIGGLVVGDRARRKGFGRALVAAAETWAKAHGYGIVSLRSNTARVEARPFYESQGYRVTKTQYKFQKDLH